MALLHEGPRISTFGPVDNPGGLKNRESQIAGEKQNAQVFTCAFRVARETDISPSLGQSGANAGAMRSPCFADQAIILGMRANPKPEQASGFGATGAGGGTRRGDPGVGLL